MRKFLPLIFLLVGVVVGVVAFFFSRNQKEDRVMETFDEELSLADIPLEKRPVVSLIPTADGHYLKLKVEKIRVDGAETLDYELLYKVSDGVTQGVPGSVKIKGKESFETDLLLGSESSGKFRYDEGVEDGTITLRFRNDKGKLMAKFSTDFKMFTKVSDLISADNSFTYKLSKVPKQGFFVVMQTFGLPEMVNQGRNIESGPYGVFSSLTPDLDADINFNKGTSFYRFDGQKWIDVKSGSLKGIGIFVSLSE